MQAQMELSDCEAWMAWVAWVSSFSDSSGMKGHRKEQSRTVTTMNQKTFQEFCSKVHGEMREYKTREYHSVDIFGHI